MTGEGIGELAACLLRVATDSAEIQRLHDLLGGFCHRCRNSLNSLKMGLYLARRSEGSTPSEMWAELEAQYQSAERIIDRLQQICRPMPLSFVRLPLGLFLAERRESWERTLAEHGRRLEMVPGPDAPDGQRVVGHYDPSRLGLGLDAFVAWRAKAVGEGPPLRLRWGEDHGRFQMDWEEPAFRVAGPSGRPADGADPLALPMLTRIIAEHGGTVSLSTDEGGMRMELRWPLEDQLSRRDALC